MTAGRRQDDPTPDDLLTAEDLFGDLVDAPHEASRASPGRRKRPIRVQVSEPEGLPKEEPPGSGEPRVLPEDVAVLLEAFADPLPDGSTRAEPTPPRPLDSESNGPKPSEDADRLLEALKPAAAAPVPGSGPPRPPATALALGREAREDAERLLASIRPAAAPPPRPSTGGDVEALLAQIEVPGVRTTARFRATTPRREATGAGGLDLAAVAEDALGSAPKPPASGEVAPVSAYGPYLLLQKVAVGGMAEVFKAKRTGVEGFEKVLAVKRILPHLSDNKEFVDMFIDEAKMVAGLTHPNIVQIYDLGKIEKSYYIAMEHVHGRDLRSIQKRAKDRGLRIPLDLSVLIVSRVCLALEYAHRKKDDEGRPMQIVHRDVSPQNILISFEGDVKLTDFGIAKAATKASTTDRGALRGKLLYMSPEQAWGKPIDRRCDLFSLGIVCYELITDDKPFLGGSEMGILEMVRECRIASPRQSNPRIPESLERAVMRALQRDPEERYQDASEMYKDLERVLSERRPPGASELARLMEVLFDERERGAPPAEPRGEAPTAGRPALELEFDAVDEQGSDADERRARVPNEPMSVEQLLERFGKR